MIRAGIIGLGKMGISHLAIINSHPEVEVVGVCDVSGLVLSALQKYSKTACFEDYHKMIEQTRPDCVIIATPTKLHAEMLIYAIERNVHVFVEKPFCLKLGDGKKIVELVKQRKLVNQTGYHNRFIGAFQETRKLLGKKVIGDIYYVHAESFGPVVLKSKGRTWRSSQSEGGGCLYDYAAHVINLVDYLVGRIEKVKGTILKKIYSKDVEDAVFSSIVCNNGISGQLCVNWSDESYRKMSTKITLYGTLGKITVDALECRIYLRENNKSIGMGKGWNIRYITDTTNPVWFNLRGEEYSAQIDYFINCLINKKSDNINSFASALRTDKVINLLQADAIGNS
jgi:predicted dehydrogenase